MNYVYYSNTDEKGATPLHHAAEQGNIAAVKALLAEGGNVNSRYL